MLRERGPASDRCGNIDNQAITSTAGIQPGRKPAHQDDCGRPEHPELYRSRAAPSAPACRAERRLRARLPPAGWLLPAIDLSLRKRGCITTASVATGRLVLATLILGYVGRRSPVSTHLIAATVGVLPASAQRAWDSTR
jgi:hypothetical protein